MSLLSYKILGKGSPIVLLHGFLENSKMWDFLILTNKNYQWILIDLPGHGNSKNYFVLHSMEFMADKVKQILDKEKISNAFFIGHSMGGYVALAFNEIYSNFISGLCMFFSHPFPDSIEKKEQRLKAVEVVEKNIETYIKLSIPILFNQNTLEKLKDEIKQAKNWAKETSLLGITSSLLGMRERPDRSTSMLNASFPVLTLCGSHDVAVPTSEIEKRFKNVKNIQFQELPIGHMGHLEDPKSCKEIIIDYLNENYN